MVCNKRSYCNEQPLHHKYRKPVCSKEDPTQPKVNIQVNKLKRKKQRRKDLMEFPGGPVVRTWCFYRRGPGSIPDWGTRIPLAT